MKFRVCAQQNLAPLTKNICPKCLPKISPNKKKLHVKTLQRSFFIAVCCCCWVFCAVAVVGCDRCCLSRYVVSAAPVPVATIGVSAVSVHRNQFPPFLRPHVVLAYLVSYGTVFSTCLVVLPSHLLLSVFPSCCPHLASPLC